MPNLNRVMLMGNLTRDPEMRYLPSNMAVVNLGLAVNRRWKNQNGEQQEETTFVDCEAFGRTAEVISQYLRKGRPIYIEGRLRLDQWQDKDGNNRSKMKVVVENFQFLDNRMEGGEGAPAGPAPRSASGPSRSAPRSNQPSSSAPQPPMDGDPHTPVSEENIPF